MYFYARHNKLCTKEKCQEMFKLYWWYVSNTVNTLTYKT